MKNFEPLWEILRTRVLLERSTTRTTRPPGKVVWGAWTTHWSSTQSEVDGGRMTEFPWTRKGWALRNAKWWWRKRGRRGVRWTYNWHRPRISVEWNEKMCLSVEWNMFFFWQRPNIEIEEAHEKKFQSMSLTEENTELKCNLMFNRKCRQAKHGV